MTGLNRDRLKNARKAAHLTQDEVGAALGKSRAFLSDIESGKKTGSLETLIALSQLYNVSLDFLCGLSSGSDNESEEYIVHEPDERRLIAIWRLISEAERLDLMTSLALKMAGRGGKALSGHEETPQKTPNIS
ncbi:helix-turn-helix domain-containing protein [Saccharibacter floricola]|uniref:Transcriptional regulator n=1 Tax=Saccharibacter floricola DSM 15669 TaxID=1123227 RepID=A0ABQ0P1I0_9PROT|nr:helix-turn-helix transcriptional regulator [Saccharibacter floricola]GBQ09074.1 transcriptional regulator [Saccharibacter floricola DSM 15669]